MTNRIPPSLKWLVTTRARLAGELEKTKRSLKRAHELIDELKVIEDKLKAVDITLAMHDIQIDTSLISPIQTKELKLNIPHGELTKSIILCLRMHGGNKPISKSEILNFIIIRHFSNTAEAIPQRQIKRSIKNRLTGLFREGVLIRHHNDNDEGLWSLAPEYIIE